MNLYFSVNFSENTALARRVAQSADNDDDDTNLDVHALVEKIAKLKGMLKLANQRSENPVNLSGKKLFNFTVLKEGRRFPIDVGNKQLIWIYGQYSSVI